jgi:hypothetical protein
MRVPVPLTSRTVEQGRAVYVPEKDPSVTLSAVVSGPGFTKQEDPFAYDDQPKDPTAAERKGLRGFVGAGPVVVFGVASWMPAVGAALSGGMRFNDYVSIGLEARAAWLTTGVADQPINAMTAGGIASLCGHYKVFLGCALGHLGVINIDVLGQSYKPAYFVNFRPGAGVRIGGTVPVTRAVRLEAAADVLGLTRGLGLVVNDTIILEQPPVMIGAHIAGRLEF